MGFIHPHLSTILLIYLKRNQIIKFYFSKIPDIMDNIPPPHIFPFFGMFRQQKNEI